MQRKMLLGKIHRATVTEADLHYKGSITIDADLMEASGILEYEQVDIWNITNGERFSTYAITGQSGSGTICINGAAAHKATVGDMIIIGHFAWMSEAEAIRHKPKVVMVDDENRAINYNEPDVRDLQVMNMLI
jgi:aspartate 1-decarboxylase